MHERKSTNRHVLSISFLRERVATLRVLVVAVVVVVGEACVCNVHGPIGYDYWGHYPIMGLKVLMTYDPNSPYPSWILTYMTF